MQINHFLFYEIRRFRTFFIKMILCHFLVTRIVVNILNLHGPFDNFKWYFLIFKQKWTPEEKESSSNQNYGFIYICPLRRPLSIFHREPSLFKQFTSRTECVTLATKTIHNIQSFRNNETIHFEFFEFIYLEFVASSNSDI